MNSITLGDIALYCPNLGNIEEAENFLFLAELPVFEKKFDFSIYGDKYTKCLIVAHHTTLARTDKVLSSEGASKETASYDIGADVYDLTVYGRLLKLAKKYFHIKRFYKA